MVQQRTGTTVISTNPEHLNLESDLSSGDDDLLGVLVTTWSDYEVRVSPVTNRSSHFVCSSSHVQRDSSNIIHLQVSKDFVQCLVQLVSSLQTI